MRVKRISPITGEATTRDLPVTRRQLHCWRNGHLIQDVMPELSADDREWLITGLTTEQWNEIFEGDNGD